MGQEKTQAITKHGILKSNGACQDIVTDVSVTKFATDCRSYY